MKLLALDTSTDRLSLALALPGQVHAFDEVVGQRHAEMILGEIDALLRAAGLDKRELDAIAFGSGPGAFTGLRIACGVAQGLARALDVPVLGVSTLEAMAQACGAARVVACLDARMGEVYYAAYSKSQDEWSEVSAPGLYAPASIPLPPGGGWTGCGNAFAAHVAALEARLGAALIGIDPHVYPSASAIAAVALPRLRAGKGLPAAQALPRYIRDKVALKTNERTNER